MCSDNYLAKRTQHDEWHPPPPPPPDTFSASIFRCLLNCHVQHHVGCVLKECSITLRRARNSGRASAPLCAQEGTTTDGTDSNRLVSVAGVDEALYFLQDEFVVKASTRIVVTQDVHHSKNQDSYVAQASPGKEPGIVICAYLSHVASVNC